MKLIERKQYLDKMVGVIGTPDIKVLTGVRRSGKSKLLEAFKSYVQNDIPNANIIHINFNLSIYDDLKEYKALNEYVEGNYIEGKQNFVLIDEIQMCKGFELCINNLHATEAYNIYITGSNAFLLSSDLATLFTGRVFEIKVYPFSFAEYVDYFGASDKYNAFDSYMLEGGMSGSYVYKEQEDKYDYIETVFDTLILRDIRQKYKIKNSVLMDRITQFLMDNVSNLTSARSIADTLTSNKEKINHKTVANYLNYLCNAFAFYKIRRYDINGKRYLASNDKYYLSDHTFRYAKLGTKNLDNGRVIENIVAMELLRRGYEVYAGVLYKKEIDFVALKRNEKLYIQVSDNITHPDTFKRETDPLLKIKDAYPKTVIARTRNPEYQYEGIRIIDVSDWLLNK
ncbi:MAG: ATP-binding protein [Clostridia bacterium]|nr:ATP-binding protein [Clostridia bacterium]MBQ1935209.1 ATP-binding protein [Clostridia bacterium]MBQ5809459.1 ATP-binding protein [Clostridia bacterium]